MSVAVPLYCKLFSATNVRQAGEKLMEYRVFNENNCLAVVTDEQLEIAFMQKEDLPVEIVPVLQRKERSLPLEDLNHTSSEKVILRSMLIRLEGGSSAVQAAFFDKHISPQIKFRFMFLYSAFAMLLEDLHFIINALEAIALREECADLQQGGSGGP